MGQRSPRWQGWDRSNQGVGEMLTGLLLELVHFLRQMIEGRESRRSALQTFSLLVNRAQVLTDMAERASDPVERDRLLSEAVDKLSEAAQLQVGKRDLARAWVKLAKCNRARGYDSAAMDGLDRALSFWPGCPEAHLELARLYLAQGQANLAFRHSTKALRKGGTRTRSDARRLMDELIRLRRPRAERRLVVAGGSQHEEEILAADL